MARTDNEALWPAERTGACLQFLREEETKSEKAQKQHQQSELLPGEPDRVDEIEVREPAFEHVRYGL
jgi:hypothetical protein